MKHRIAESVCVAAVAIDAPSIPMRLFPTKTISNTKFIITETISTNKEAFVSPDDLSKDANKL